MIIIPKHWTRQPQIPVGINKGHPFAATALLLANVNTLVDVTKGQLPTIEVPASQSPTVGVPGVGRAFVGNTTTGLLYANRPMVASPRITFVSVFSYAGASPNFYPVLLSTSTLNSGVALGDGVVGNGSVFGIRKGGVANLPTVALTANVPYVCIAGCDDVSGAYYTTVRRMDTGEITSVSGTSATTSGSPDGTYAIGIGRRDINGSWNGNIWMGAIFGDYFTEAQATHLLYNPWQLFAPLPRRIFVDAPSGVTNPVGFGTDTLKALTDAATGRSGALAGATDTLRALTESATGVVASAQVGFASGALNALTDTATGRTGARGTASDTLKALTEQATGFTSVNPVGYATDTLKALTETATGRTGVRGTAADTLQAFNEAATGLAGALGNARDTLKALTASATGNFASNDRQGFGTDTLKALTSQATGRAGAVAGAVDTFKALTEQAQGRTGMVGFSVDSLKALQAAAGAVSGAQPIAPPGPSGGAPVWWPSKPGSRPWWYRDLKDKADELERMRQLRIEMGILPKAEAKRIAKVVREVDAFIEEIPTEYTADEYIARADALTERINALVDKIEEDDDEQTIMEMSRFFFHHRTGAIECRIH